MIDILLCATDQEETAQFYRALGIELFSEQHGNGPQHFSFSQSVVPEIYPLRTTTPNAQVVMRVTVDDIEDVVLQLVSVKHTIISSIIELSSGRKIILQDPDGRAVEVFQPLINKEKTT